MQTYEIIVSGRAVHANSADTTLVRTSIGIDKIHVLFDNEEWTAFPVRVTFANGDTIISTSLTLAEIDAPEWAAEAECAIPWEVIQDLGGIRITFQGTDASGNHIITEASGEPLSVVEAGDVGSGTVPSPAPSVDEWNQAYANAMAAANSASGAAESANEAAERANTAAAEAEQVLVDGIPLMDADTRGGATLGSGLRVDDGALSLGDLTQSGSGAEVVTDGCAIFSVEGEGWATQDGTPTPDNPVEIEVARGRNLIDESKSSLNSLVFNTDGHEIAFTNIAHTEYIKVEANTDYYVTNGIGIGAQHPGAIYDANKQYLRGLSITGSGSQSTVINTGADAAYVIVNYYMPSNIAYVGPPQLELGTTPTPYVPYGHVGLEVTHDGTTTVTPIPLPSKGFAASLPDGTADALTVDSAGRWEWVNGISPLSLAIANMNNQSDYPGWKSSGIKEIIGIAGTGVLFATNGDVMSNSAQTISYNTTGSGDITFFHKVHYGGLTQEQWIAQYPDLVVELLIKRATPTTEHGYIDLPALPSGAVVSCPELDEIGCSWFVDGCEPIVEHAANMAKRETEENESIEDALAELAARVAALES